METLWSISMFLISPLLAYIVHIRSGYHKGGGYSNRRKALIFLLYLLSINVCTFLVSCARGIGEFHFAQMTVSYRLKYIGVGLAFGLLFWLVSLLPKLETYNAGQRNYELDFFRLVFAICVFMSHTGRFIKENTKVTLPVQIGQIAVYFFFVLSGMLMANSILKKEQETTECGKLAALFVMKKFKALAWDVYAALFVFMSVYIFTIPPEKIPDVLVKLIPELFFATRAGIDTGYNVPGWYLSAMFFCMLPLSYLLYKERDFTRHILAPLLAVFVLGWICQINDYNFLQQHKQRGLFMGGMYAAASGLCFGICAYNIYIRLYRARLNENMRMLLTVIEVFLYGVFFGTWFLIRDNQAIMSVILLLPIAIAITFSGKSYIVRLFQFDWMKCFAPLSLTIYLNHWIGRVLVLKYFEGSCYGFCVFMMAVFTLGSCLLSTCLKKIGKFMWNNKLKIVLFNCE